MKLSVILVIAILLAAGVLVELKVRDDHSHAAAHSALVTTTTRAAAVTDPDPLLASEQHDACGDLSTAQVEHAIGGSVANRSIIESAVVVDPDWQKAPVWAGCVWATHTKGNTKSVNALELFVAAFNTPAAASKFYHEQVAGYDGFAPGSNKIVSVGSKALFIPQTGGHSGGQINVVQGHVAVRVESLIKTRVVTKKQSVEMLEHLATTALQHIKA